MCWNNVEFQCKMVYETPFIRVEKPLDRKFIIHIISEEFPDLPRVRIAANVDRRLNAKSYCSLCKAACDKPELYNLPLRPLPF